MRERFACVRERVADWTVVDPPEEPVAYRSMLAYQLRAGLPAIPGPPALVAYHAYAYGPVTLPFAAVGLVAFGRASPDYPRRENRSRTGPRRPLSRSGSAARA